MFRCLTWLSILLKSGCSSSTSKYTSEDVMETVPETETPGETRTAVVLMLIGPTIIINILSGKV